MKSALSITYKIHDHLIELGAKPTQFIPEDPTSLDYLLWMCEEIISNDRSWSVDKAHRWIGYIQGVMVAKGWTTVDSQRDLVRESRDA